MVKFSDKVSKGLTRPKRKLIHQMIYGIQVSKDIKISEIARALNEKIKTLKTEIRLCRNLQDKKLTAHINERLLEQARSKIDRDTVLATDLTSIEKRYAKKMPFLAQVWSGMKKDIVKGYQVLEVIGANVYDEKLLPVYSKLYSQNADRFKSENDQILEAIDKVSRHTKKKGIYVIDRGGDRKKLIKPMLLKKLRFIIRLKGDRLLALGNNRLKKVEDIANRYVEYTHKYKVEIDSQGFKEKKEIEIGKKKVRLPGEKQSMWLVAVKGFGHKPMTLLTNVEKNPVIILEMYLTRWKVEESIRFLKQQYNLEDIRLRSYAALQNTVALLSAVFYFLSVHLGHRLKMDILVKKLCEKAKRFFQVPTFKQYALADGIFRVLFNSRWECPWDKRKTPHQDKQLFLFPMAP